MLATAKVMGLFVIGSVGALAAGGVATTAPTSTQTIAVTADAFVSTPKPSTNYGTTSALRVDGSPVERAYLRFDVAAFSGQVTRATLRVSAKSGSSVGVTVWGVAASTWGEKTITWSNAPSLAATSTASSGAFGAGWVALDVSRLVVGSGAVSFAVTTAGTTALNLRSRESGASTAPQLVVETQAVAPSSTSAPTVGGTVEDGRTLTADPGSWSGTPPIAFAYGWRRCDGGGAGCQDIAGATTQSYAVTAADVGSTLRVAVTGTNGAGASTVMSAATGAATAAPPASTSEPTISGTAQEGQVLSAGPGSWSGTQPLVYGYQWRRCDSTGAAASCTDMAGSTAQTVTLSAADVGSTVRVAVTARNAAGSATAASAATAAVAAAPPPASPPTNVAPPTISGVARSGETLTGDSGTWTGTPPIVYGYVWQRCDGTGAGCGDIAGATAASYRLAAADVGSTIRLAVSAGNSAGTSGARSSATATIAAAPPVAPDPVVAAAGDIACASATTTTGTTCHYGATAAEVTADPAITDVLTLGDNQYECGDYSRFLSYYDPTWGVFRSRTHPAAGNHEYTTAPGSSSCDPASTTAAKGYFDYWNGVGVATGPAGDRATATTPTTSAPGTWLRSTRTARWSAAAAPAPPRRPGCATISRRIRTRARLPTGTIPGSRPASMATTLRWARSGTRSTAPASTSC